MTAGWRHKTLGSAAALSPMNFWLGRETPCKEFCNKALEDSDIHIRDVLVTNFYEIQGNG